VARLFATPDLDIAEGARSLAAAAAACSADLETVQVHPDFRRYLATREDGKCVVDLVIDRAKGVVPEKVVFEGVRVDSLREIAANKICTVLARAEIKDLVDLQALLAAGVELQQALDDAALKDAGVDPATLAWVLSEITIADGARLPGQTDPAEIDSFRLQLVRELRALAFARARR
jgi:hypothetical protein